VRLNFNVGGLYQLPDIHALGNWAGRGWQLSTIFTAISGRPFTPILSGGDPSGQGLIGNSIRPSWDGTPIKYNTRNPDAYVVEHYTVAGQLDPCGDNVDTSGNILDGYPLSPFYAPCSGTAGNLRRNALIGPGLSQWDLTLAKNTKFSERLNVEFRWEVFNVLNRGNFYYFPNNALTVCPAQQNGDSGVAPGGQCISNNGGNFAQIPKTSDVAAGNPVIAQGGPRNMNFSIKFIF
jgi:hypothetical protein